MDEQLQQFLLQYAQGKGMDEQQTQQFMQEFAQASPQEQQAFLQQAQQGMQPQQQGQAEEMQQGGWSTQGYKQNSPDRFKPVNYIPSNNITMKGVDQPLMLYGDGGDVVYAQPGQDYVLPNSQTVMEVPVAQQGGKQWLLREDSPIKHSDWAQPAHLLETYDLEGFNATDGNTDSYGSTPTKKDILAAEAYISKLRTNKNPVISQQYDRVINAPSGRKYYLNQNMNGQWFDTENREWTGDAKANRFQRKPAVEQPSLYSIVGGRAAHPGMDWDEYNGKWVPEEQWVDLTVPAGKKPAGKRGATAKQTFTAKAKQRGAASSTTAGGKPYAHFLPDADGDLENLPAMIPTVVPMSISQESLERGMERVPQPENAQFVPVAGKAYQPKGPTAVNPFKPDASQFVPDIAKLLDAQNRQPGYRPHLDEAPLTLSRFNPTAARAQLFGAYRQAGNGVTDPHTQIGRGMQLQQYSNFLNALNSLSGQTDAQNVQIANQETQYNNQMQRQTAGTNLQFNKQAYLEDVGTAEAQRQSTLEAVGSMSTKLAQAKQLERNYNLFKSAYASKYQVNRDGTVSYDESAPDVQFSNGSLGLNNNPNTRTKEKVTRGKDGAVTKTEFTTEELQNAAAYLRGQSVGPRRQQGGTAFRGTAVRSKARRYQMQ